MTNWKQAWAASGLMLLGLVYSASSLADTRAAIDQNVHDTLKTFFAANPKHRELAHKAAGIVVFPRITKGGAGIAGEYGEGVLRVHGKNVEYYKIAAGSIGLTLGVGERSEIIMFMTQQALDKFTNSKGWTIDADAGIAVVSKGAGGAYDPVTMHKPILGFVFNEKGLIGDLSFEGSKISLLSE